MTMSGLRSGRSICRRSMWNICAGVEGTHTCMLYSAQSCRKRSEPRRGVLRTLALVAMRQEQREARQPAPLRLARADELIDDDLRAIAEIAELRLPRWSGNAARWSRNRTRTPSPPLRTSTESVTVNVG